MIFWILWVIAFIPIACFFFSSVVAYLSPARTGGSMAEGAAAWFEEGQLTALEAQFFLAPQVAIAEFRDMLTAAGMPEKRLHEVHDRSSFVQAVMEVTSVHPRR